MFKELSLSAQTSYGELLDQVRARDIDSLSSLTGSFHARMIRGKSYVYFGYRDAEGLGRMVYIGPNDERVCALIKKFKAQKNVRQIEPMVKSSLALGCQSMMQKHFKITKQLADYGFFKAGGILVGTHAFLAMANMLGIKWNSGDKTLDVDFAHAGKNISIALLANMKISVHDALTSLEMGLLPIQQFSGKAGAQYRNPNDPELRVDFLTPMGRNTESVEIAHLGLSLEPLRFMEFSLEGSCQAVVMGRNNACLVNIPDPARFAIHKMIVYGERKPSERIKSFKDLEQAAALIFWHVSNGLEQAIVDAWKDAQSRGPGWRLRANEGLAAMLKRHPELNLDALWNTADILADGKQMQNIDFSPKF